MSAPNGFSIAVVDGGQLTLVDGRGEQWRYDPGKAPKDKDGKPTGPQGFKEAFVRGDFLSVIDESEYFWTYSVANGWKKGGKLGDGENDEDPGPWIAGRNIAAPAPEEPAKK